jgi:hypothetical protein
MATIIKNRNFFKWPKLLYFKPESVIAMNICIGRVATYILDKKKFRFLVMAAILDTGRR